MSDDENNPTLHKGVIAYRIVIAVMMFIGAVIGNRILGYAESSSNTLSRVDKDVTQIKWELPVIKSTIASDKIAAQKQIDNMQSSIDALRDRGDLRTERISDLQTELKLLKQKLQVQ